MMALPRQHQGTVRIHRLVDDRREPIEPAERRQDAPLTIAEEAGNFLGACQPDRLAEGAGDGVEIDA